MIIKNYILCIYNKYNKIYKINSIIDQLYNIHDYNSNVTELSYYAIFSHIPRELSIKFFIKFIAGNNKLSFHSRLLEKLRVVLNKTNYNPEMSLLHLSS